MKNEEILKENYGKHFDIVLMNPPYDRSLHLKFLEKVIEIADNVVSIQPTRWIEEVNIQEVSSQAKKYENSISKHIKDLEIIYAERAKIDFHINLSMNLGIYVCDENGGYDYKKLSENIEILFKREIIQLNIAGFSTPTLKTFKYNELDKLLKEINLLCNS